MIIKSIKNHNPLTKKTIKFLLPNNNKSIKIRQFKKYVIEKYHNFEKVV